MSSLRRTTLALALAAALAGDALAQPAPPPAPAPAPAPAAGADDEARPAGAKKGKRKGKGAGAPAAGAAGAGAGAAPAPGAPEEPPNLPPGTTEQLPTERAATDCPKLNPNRRYKWDQKGEIDLAALLTWAQSAFCQPIIVPTNLRQQKISIYAPTTMTPAEMYRMFLSSLNAMGLTVQPQGPKGRPTALVVIESSRARETAIPTVAPGDPVPANDQYVTKVIRLSHVSTEELLPILNRLKSQPGDVIAAPPQTLIVTDVADNIRRMEGVINMLDLPMGGERIWLIKLKTVGATEMANLLKEIFQPKGGAGGAPRGRLGIAAPQPGGGPTVVGGAGDSGGGDQSVSQIIPDDRTNSLIIVATERAYQRIRGLVDRLDQQGSPLDAASDRVHVYFLANAKAEELAGILSGIGASVSGGGRAGGPRAAQPVGGQQQNPLFENEVRVAADKATNSLIIVASGKDYLTLRDLIRKLDIARRQVFIEATILEVSLDKARKLGLSFHGGSTVFGGDQQSLLFGGIQPNSSVNSILFSPAALSGLAAGLRGPNIPNASTILGLPPGQSIPAFGVFIQALQNNNDVNVVSMPHILTSDNEKATIQVGRNLPFPGSLGGFPGLGATGATGQTGAAGGLGFGFGTSVQRQDVALKLDVTPHVNDSDFVRLEVDNEISDVASENFNGLGPATDKRTVKTVVVVRDQQPVVLGGLIKDRIAESVDKVPLLGDIPILGYLFKYTRRTVLKQNLLIILTPYIIKDPMDLRRIFERKIAERKEFLERYSAFQDDRDYDAIIDYTKKRGLLEEINRVAIEAEVEARELQAAQSSALGLVLEGPVEPAPLPPPRPRPAPPVVPSPPGTTVPPASPPPPVTPAPAPAPAPRP